MMLRNVHRAAVGIKDIDKIIVLTVFMIILLALFLRIETMI